MVIVSLEKWIRSGQLESRIMQMLAGNIRHRVICVYRRCRFYFAKICRFTFAKKSRFKVTRYTGK